MKTLYISPIDAPLRFRALFQRSGFYPLTDIEHREYNNSSKAYLELLSDLIIYLYPNINTELGGSMEWCLEIESTTPIDINELIISINNLDIVVMNENVSVVFEDDE